jgi:multidrug efflux pump
VKGVRWLIHHRRIGVGIFLGVVLGVVFMFRILPGSFVPVEDQGYLFGVSMMPDAASLERTTAADDKATEAMLSRPAVSDTAQIDGYSLIDGQYKTNAGKLFITLKPYEEREDASLSSFALLNESRKILGSIKDGILFAVAPPSIPGLGTTGGFEFYLQDRAGGTPQALAEVNGKFLAAARARPELTAMSTTFSASEQQLYLDVDRARAELLNVPVQDVYQTLQAYFGSLYVSQFTEFGRIWQVIIQAESQYRDDPADFSTIYLKSTIGESIPLSAIATARYVAGPNVLPRFNAFPAAKLTGHAAPGFSSGEALAAMEAVAAEVLPDGYAYEWSGQAYEEKKAGGTSTTAFIFGIIMVFLILAAQYEKWTLPFGVLLAVPFAILGALCLTWARGLENDVYFQVGLVTLIGLSAKNAILITEYAVENYHSGMSLEDAAAEAAHVRLRPIVMTSMAFILGCVPMAIASGPGANSLHAIGTGVIGGMLASTLISSFFVPMFFVIVESFSEKGESKQETADAPAVAAPAPGEGGH